MSWSRTYSVKKFVERARNGGGRRPGEGWDARVARVHRGRRPTDSFLAAADLDIHDLIGGSLREFRRCAGDVAPLMDQLAALMHPGKSSKAVTALAPSPLRSRRALPCRR